MVARDIPFNDVTILLVDDDDVDVMGVKRVCKKLEICSPIIRARDGVEGLALIRKLETARQSYIVLLDINLPRMNGLEMLERVRDDPALANAEVFILTTSKAGDDKLKAFALNAAGYIHKSQVSTTLLQIIGPSPKDHG
jgi:CheY-like chemotaxis protein